MVLPTLGARQYGVVVRHGDTSSILWSDEVTVNLANAHDHRVSCGLDDTFLQFRNGVVAIARCGHQRTIFEERTVVAKVVDVLSCCPFACVVTFGRGLYSRFIGGQLMEVIDLCNIIANAVEVERFAGVVFTSNLRWFNKHNRRVFKNGIADGQRQFSDDP